MTFQVAMIGSNGWVLASDGRATIQGGIRSTYQTEKIRYENDVATAPFGDECALIARDRLLVELQPDPAKMNSGDFHHRLARLAEEIWLAEYEAQKGRPEANRIRAERERGIIFLCPGINTIFVLGIGKQALVQTSTSRWVAGDSQNSATFVIQRYYDKSYSTDALAMLAAYAVVSAAALNPTMISGLELMLWENGASAAEWLNADDYEVQCKLLDAKISSVIREAMSIKKP